MITLFQETTDSPGGTLRTSTSSSSRSSAKMNTIAGSAKLRNATATAETSDQGPSTMHTRHNTTKLPQIPNSIA